MKRIILKFNILLIICIMLFANVSFALIPETIPIDANNLELLFNNKDDPNRIYFNVTKEATYQIIGNDIKVYLVNGISRIKTWRIRD